MSRKHRFGDIGSSVVVVNQDLQNDPMKRYSNDELITIKSCCHCSIHTGGETSAWGSPGGGRAGGASATVRTAASAAAARTAAQNGAGAFIPFASGSPIAMTAPSGGQDGTAGIIGFGNSADGIPITGEAVDTSAVPNMAFLLPEGGNVTSFAAHFSTTQALELGGAAVTIRARLYQSPLPGNHFVPVPSAVVPLSPVLSGTVSAGSISSGSLSNLSIPLTGGTRLMVVFSAEVTAGIGAAVSVAGYASAGLSVR